MATLTVAGTSGEKVSEGSQVWDEDSVRMAGVPDENVECVLEMLRLLGLVQGVTEPLADPLTILRFLTAREMVVEDAIEMYRSSVDWRKDFDVGSVMAEYGIGHAYDNASGMRLVEGNDFDHWGWSWRPQTPTAEKLNPLGFFGKLSTTDSDGAPIAVWRVAAADFAGFYREQMIEEATCAFVAHLEDNFQAGRALSLAQKRLIRIRLVIDAQGLSIGILRQLSVVKAILGLGKAYFPEISVTVAIVRAHWVFSRVFSLISPLLTAVMKRKICILGEDFAEDLKRHSQIDISVLPKFMGGDVSDAEVLEGAKVPVGLGDELRAMRDVRDAAAAST